MTQKSSEGMSFRPLNDSDRERLEDVLRRLREHYPEWPTQEGNEHHLVAFAYYEGLGGSEHCGAILAEASPFALGRELVVRYGFEWVMIESDRFAVTHPALDRPIDLLSLEDGSWNRTEYDPGCSPSPGKATHDSLSWILERVGLAEPE